MTTRFARAGRAVTRDISDTVTLRDVRTITVSPSTAEVAQSATQQYTAAYTNQFGETVPVAAADIAWTRSSAPAGTISSSGLLTAGTTPGTYQVRATHTPTAVYDEADAVVS